MLGNLRPHRPLPVAALVCVTSVACTTSTTDPLPDAGFTFESTDAGTNPASPCPPTTPGVQRPAGWGADSHCVGVAGNYAKLFDPMVVHRLDIEIAPDVYQATLDDLDDKLSGGGPGPGANEDPMWVEVEIGFEGLTWTHVGMRYKGNSSLRSAWQSGTRKLAFRLHFDRFEDVHPELEDQRFFGFRKMTFSNGFKDPSLIRDKIGADVFRAGGIVAARGAFARVFIDHGQGPVYFGLYTMIEDPSNRLLDTQFADDNGNLYKPEGDGAKWGRFVQEHFDKKTNIDAADFTDVIAAIDALHSDKGDPAAWRQRVEAVFDARGFLRCLAFNQAMVNWDSYGFMSHNYYVYGDASEGGRLAWFPWDLNEIMLIPRRRPGGSDPTSIMLDDVGADWPLIRFLLDDPEYRQLYRDELRAAIEGGFEAEAVIAKMKAYHDLIAPYVIGPDGETAPYTFLRRSEEFETSITGSPEALEPHVRDRHAAVRQELGL